MSSLYIHCRLITFPNHQQTHGSLFSKDVKWLLFIVDLKMDPTFIFICFFISFLCPAVFHPVVLVTLPIWLLLWCLSQIHVHVCHHVALRLAHSCLPEWGPPNTHTHAQGLSQNGNLCCCVSLYYSTMPSNTLSYSTVYIIYTFLIPIICLVCKTKTESWVCCVNVALLISPTTFSEVPDCRRAACVIGGTNALVLASMKGTAIIRAVEIQ